jgi:hypothetical protein
MGHTRAHAPKNPIALDQRQTAFASCRPSKRRFRRHIADA